MPEKIKQVIVIRKDLKMRRGKEIAQGAHASIAFLSNRVRSFYDGIDSGHGGKLGVSKAQEEWLRGIFTKICLRVNSEEELLEIDRKAREAGLEVHLITDSGKTEFNGIPTHTCLAIGPDEAEKIDMITSDLELY